MRFFVRIFGDEGNYSALVPDLPGCVAAGDTVTEVRRLIAEAISLHLELLSQPGGQIPVPEKRLCLEIDAMEDGELCTWVEVKLAQPV